MNSSKTTNLAHEDLSSTRNCELAALLVTLGFRLADDSMQILTGDLVAGGRCGVWRFLPALAGFRYNIKQVIRDGVNPRLAESPKAYIEQAYIAAGYHNFRQVVESVMTGSRLRLVACGYLHLLLRDESRAYSGVVQTADAAFAGACTANAELVAALATLGFCPEPQGSGPAVGPGIAHGRAAVWWQMPPVSADGVYRLNEVMARYRDDAWCARPGNNHPVACLADGFYNLRELRAELEDSRTLVQIAPSRGRLAIIPQHASPAVIRQAERFILNS